MEYQNIAALTLPLIKGKKQVIIPSGIFDAPTGALKGKGPWVLNDTDGQALVEKLNNLANVDIVIDYEHQSLFASQSGKPAPAAGWLQRGGFVWDAGLGLIATMIRWTNDAADMIKEGKYRFLSPVFAYNTKGVPQDLISVGITNTPALSQLQELAVASRFKGNEIMALEESITQETVQETIVQPVEAQVVAVAAATQSTSVIKPAIKPAMDVATAHPMIAALTSQVSALSIENARLQAAYDKLQGEISESYKESMITAALSTGQLLPGMDVWARNVTLEELSSFLSKAKPIAALTSMQTRNKAPEGVDEKKTVLNADEIAVCSQLNIKPELFIKQKESMNGRS